jgi:hypothetical protein
MLPVVNQYLVASDAQFAAFVACHHASKSMVWATIQCHRRLFASAVAAMFGILGVTVLLLRLGAFRWGVMYDQILKLGSALAGLMLLLAAAGFVGYRIAGRLD